MAIILGIDPGLKGAMALYDGTNFVISDIPTFTLARNGKNKREVDIAGLAHILKGQPVDHAWLEQIHAMPGQGVSSMFAFGQVFGIIKGILGAYDIPITTVPPQVWKAALKVPAAKDGARARASQLLPMHANQWPLVKHDGRAEAALIALYGYGKFTLQPEPETW
jgi:crossover junction endodeoxyribonuclease RuvC